jgi:hypothetical protein
MRYQTILIVIAVFAFSVIAGCSSGDIPTTPSNHEISSDAGAGSHTCLGLWQFVIDPVNKSIDMVPLRSEQLHMNGLAFMEPPVGQSLAIDQIVEMTSDEVTVDIRFSHPYPGLTFACAFDVCGILISHGSTYFPLSTELYFPDEGDVQLLNPDGYTRWWNPVEFPPNPTVRHQGYIDGLMGRPNAVAGFDATLNGYKYFSSDLADPESPLTELDPSLRGAFVPGTSCVRRYRIGFSPGSLVFNYAVDASWATPANMPDPVIPDDFPYSANRPEPYRIEIQNLNNTLTYDPDSGMADGEATMSVYVYDWHNAGENMVCAFAQNDEVMGMCNPEPSEVGDGYAVYDVELMPMMMDSADDIDLWYGVECDVSGYQGILPYIRQGVYFRDTITVEEI